MSRIVERCRAKLNLFLDVVGRRDDGYHQLVTVFHEIDLYDELEVSPAPDDETTLELGGADDDIPEGDDNLALRAARLLLRSAGAPHGVIMWLEKRIPAGAGLGGGSADAAGVLRAVDRLFGLDTPRERLAELALELGSDVPFLLRGGTCLARGRGEVLESVPSRAPVHFLLLVPGFRVSTAAVYAALPRELPPPVDPSPLLSALAEGDPAALIRSTHNALLPAALAVEPRLGEVLAAARSELGPSVQLTGSGSALFLPFVGDPVLDVPAISRALPHDTALRVVV